MYVEDDENHDEDNELALLSEEACGKDVTSQYAFEGMDALPCMFCVFACLSHCLYSFLGLLSGWLGCLLGYAVFSATLSLALLALGFSSTSCGVGVMTFLFTAFSGACTFP